MRWQCRQTLRSLKQALARQGRQVELLPPLSDLDRRSDLEHWLASRAGFHRARPGGLWRVLIERLAEILAGLRQAVPFEILPGSPRVELRAHRLRGPPLPA